MPVSQKSTGNNKAIADLVNEEALWKYILALASMTTTTLAYAVSISIDSAYNFWNVSRRYSHFIFYVKGY